MALALFLGLVVLGLCIDHGLTNLGNSIAEGSTRAANAYTFRTRLEAASRGDLDPEREP